MVEPRKLFGGLGNRLFQMAYLYSQLRDGTIPDIYLQDPKYFDDYQRDIKILYGQDIGFTDKVAIHVRRGKNPSNPEEPAYSDNPYYVNLCETGYYYNAMQLFPSKEFLVFSDDIEWCKTRDVFKNCSFSEGNNEIDDLNAMASCNGHITANSSFSWWGAYLSPHGGKVVAPKNWYADGERRTECPKEWTKI